MTKSTPKKILLIGLDNAGKTSIVKCLSGTKKLTSFSEINPTKGKEIITIKVSDTDFSIWDLGGQEVFRKDYLSNFDDYIFGCNKSFLPPVHYMIVSQCNQVEFALI